MAKTKTNDVVIKAQHREVLPCKLTDADLAAVAREIGAATREREALDAKRRQAAEHFKARLDGVGARIDQLAETAASGFMEREVDVDEIHDYRDGSVRYVRRDTGEVTSRRSMTADERQGSLFDGGEPAPARVVDAAADQDLDAGPAIEDPAAVLQQLPDEPKPKAKRARRSKA